MSSTVMLAVHTFDTIDAIRNEDCLKNIERSMGNVDATYGLKGTAAPWKSSSTGELLMNGGAEQIVTPLKAEHLVRIGIIPEY